jgi:hypothetical protein
MNDIIVKPLETYVPPNVPTLAESRKNPDFLKKLPLRWRKHAALLAAAGLMGAWALAGCAEKPPEEDFRMHTGGAGGIMYVVYFTEQEALDIIRMQLEEVGLKFDAEPPDYRAEHGHAGIDLFDSERNIAITFLNWWLGGGPEGNSVTERIKNELEKQDDSITAGVFFSVETRSEEFLLEHLNQQIQYFIEHLKAEGII